ncbi:MAG: pentapeptide repeat-containing protein [Pseudomonadota bacterium]|nr:pentapeptide repeat-containing protein [Pseudomonadota bacterium]
MTLFAAFKPSHRVAVFVWALTFVASPSVAQDTVTAMPEGSADPVESGVLGDEFARDTGAIIVTAQRLGESNLFEEVDHAEDSCLLNAPRLGAKEPGFAIDASGLKRVKNLERIRRKTRAGTIFVSGGSFVGADFRKAKLYNMCFFGTDLSQSNWSGVSAKGLGFVNVDLTGAKMARSHLPSVLFRDAKLGVVDAREARWMQGRMDGGWEGSLSDLDLAGADLTDFRFVCGTSPEDGCPIERTGINLSNANLRRASMHSFFASDMALDGARVDQTELSLDHLNLLSTARLSGPIVLRSPRRAVMLFPGEASELTKKAQAVEAGMDVCATANATANANGSDTGAAAASSNVLAGICGVPGSAMRELLQSVAILETQAQDTAKYQSRRRAWAAGRDACLDFTDPEQQLNCVISAYQSRQASLRKALGKPQWLQDRGYRLFLSREAAFPTDKGAPGLYGRVLPVLLDTAVAAVIVRSDGAGGIQAKGVALEGCYFEQENLAYDVAEAKIGLTPQRPQRRRRRRAAPVVEQPLINITGRSAIVDDQGLRRASPGCGVDNPFPRMQEIALDDGLLATIWDRF